MASRGSVNIRVDYGSEFHYLDQKRNLKVKLWPFGPNGWERYAFQWSESEQHWVTDYDGLRFKQETADYALAEVLRKSGLSREDLLIKLRDLITDTRAAYPDARVAADPVADAANAPPPAELQGLDDDTVLIRLSADTCLWLLVVLSILGAKPDFPDKHVIFGSRCVTANKEMWLRSIFFVGNQIPSFWVEKLMESLSYLKNLRDEIAMWGKPSELLQRAFFEFVISSQVPETDVMYCLRAIILGPQPRNRGKIYIWMVESNPHHILKQQLSASALYKRGYTFNALPNILGCRGIKCTRRMGKVDVYLPATVVNDDMSLELAMTSVKKWEQIHCGPNSVHQPECTSYFNLQHNLIRTEDDVMALSSQSVIGGRKVRCLPDILSDFYDMPQYDSRLCQKMEIQKHRPQLLQCCQFQCRIQSINSLYNLLVLILAFVQAVYTIAAYYNQGQK